MCPRDRGGVNATHPPGLPFVPLRLGVGFPLMAVTTLLGGGRRGLGRDQPSDTLTRPSHLSDSLRCAAGRTGPRVVSSAFERATVIGRGFDGRTAFRWIAIPVSPFSVME